MTSQSLQGAFEGGNQGCKRARRTHFALGHNLQGCFRANRTHVEKVEIF